MPTSVLLAVLAGAGLLALAPALVRRYDADERMAAEREDSQARILERKSAGDNPDPSESGGAGCVLSSETPGSDPADEDIDDRDSRDGQSTAAARSGWERSGARQANSVRLSPAPVEKMGHNKEVSVASARLQAWWRKRHRRVLYVLLALNLAELLGVIFLGPGFWVGVGISATLLVLFLRFLRMRVVRESGQRRGIVAKPGSGRQVYVPAQSDGEAPVAEIDSAPAESAAAFVPGFGDDLDDTDAEPAEAEPTPPPRRRTGGIRGRSYESPANL